MSKRNPQRRQDIVDSARGWNGPNIAWWTENYKSDATSNWQSKEYPMGIVIKHDMSKSSAVSNLVYMVLFIYYVLKVIKSFNQDVLYKSVQLLRAC